MRVTLMKFIAPSIIILTLWSAIKHVFDIPSFILPSPVEVLQAFAQHHTHIFAEVQHSFGTILLGLTLATMLGFLTSLLLYYVPKANGIIKPLMLFSQTMPSFTLAPLIVLYCGFGLTSQLILMCLVLYFTITSNLTAGLDRTPAGIMDLAKLYSFTKTQTFFHLKLPSAFPQFATGLKLATVYAPVAALVGEWIGASHGIGSLILSSYTRVEIDVMFAGIMTLFAASMALYLVVGLILTGFKKYA